MFETAFGRRVLELLEHIDRRIATMAIDLTNLTAAETKLVGDVNTLLGVVQSAQAQIAALTAQLAGNTDAQTQAALDAITATLTSEDVSVVAATTSPGGTTGAGPTGTQLNSAGATVVSGASSAAAEALMNQSGVGLGTDSNIGVTGTVGVIGQVAVTGTTGTGTTGTGIPGQPAMTQEQVFGATVVTGASGPSGLSGPTFGTGTAGGTFTGS